MSVTVGFDLEALRFDERGLLPVVAQDQVKGTVLMLAFANRDAVAATIATGEAHFWSRSRGELWHKGATSGHVLEVVEILADCDLDSLLYRVRPRGPACHNGTTSCFEPNPAALELGWLFAHLAERRLADPETSYTARLLARGRTRVAQKVGEEGVETALAALAAGDDELVGEAADLLYHLLVLLIDRNIHPARVAEKLLARHRPGDQK